jgi:hypothetical protein
MKLFRVLLAGVVLVGVAALAVVSKNAESNGTRMSAAAEKFLASLDETQKKKASFDFDDKERTNWYFVPHQSPDRKPLRKGLTLEDMNAAQKQAALDLLKSTVSAPGFKAATTIMSLEKILKDLEKGGAMVRNSEWYFVSVFGTPSKTGQWGFRFEGHHLSLNFTLDKGAIVSATPCFYGANPATIKGGTRDGEQTLAGTEKFAQELIAALDEDQQKTARQKERFKETPEGKPAPNVGAPKGLAAARMNDKQKDILNKLIKDYASRMREDIAEVELDRVQKAGIDKVHFAYSREDDAPGKPYTYRVQGPTFVIEFLNVQADSAKNPANHIHSSWRNVEGDFGLTKK